MLNHLTPALFLAQSRTKRVGGTCDLARNAPRQRLHVDLSPGSAYPSTSVAWGVGLVVDGVGLGVAGSVCFVHGSWHCICSRNLAEAANLYWFWV